MKSLIKSKIMNFTEGCIYHIYNRGNNKQKIFFTESNYLYFQRKLAIELADYCDILAYCLMPNHFHLMVVVKSGENNKKRNLNNAIGVLLRSYTRAIQKQEGFIGSLFQQRTKAKELASVDDHILDYFLNCANYIHQNPKKAGLVISPEAWPYSSFREYAKLSNEKICNITLFYELAGTNEAELLDFAIG